MDSFSIIGSTSCNIHETHFHLFISIHNWAPIICPSNHILSASVPLLDCSPEELDRPNPFCSVCFQSKLHNSQGESKLSPTQIDANQYYGFSLSFSWSDILLMILKKIPKLNVLLTHDIYMEIVFWNFEEMATINGTISILSFWMSSCQNCFTNIFRIFKIFKHAY